MTDRLTAALAELVDALREERRAEIAAALKAPVRLYSIDETATVLGIGRAHLYAEIGKGRLKTVRSCRRRLVPATAISAYIELVGDSNDPDRRPAA